MDAAAPSGTTLPKTIAASGCPDDTGDAHCANTNGSPSKNEPTTGGPWRISACTEFRQGVTAHRLLFAPAYPGGVRPQDDTTGLEAGAVFGLTCRQAESQSAVVKDFQLFGLYMAIKRPATDLVLDLHSFLFQAYTNNETFAKEARRAGMEIRAIPTVLIDEQPLASGDATIRFAFPPNQPDYSLAGAHSPGGSQRHVTRGLFFSNQTGLGAMVVEMTARTSNGSLAGTVVFGQDSYWAKNSDVPAVADAFNHSEQGSGTISFA